MNRNQRFLIATLVFALAIAMPAIAAEYVWANLSAPVADGTQENQRYVKWANASNWTDTAGNAVSSYPSTAGDVAIFYGGPTNAVIAATGAIGAVRFLDGCTRFCWGFNADAIECSDNASFTDFGWKIYGNGGTGSGNIKVTSKTSADNVGGFFPNAAGLQAGQVKSLLSWNDSGTLSFLRNASAQYTNATATATALNLTAYGAGTLQTNRCTAIAMSYNGGEAYGLYMQNDAVVTLESGVFYHAPSDGRGGTFGEPGAGNTYPQGTIRVPDGRPLLWWGDNFWLIRSRIDAASYLTVNGKLTVMVGDHSSDTNEFHVSSGTLQLGGVVSGTMSSQAPYYKSNPSTTCAMGNGAYNISWSGRLVVGCAGAVNRDSDIRFAGRYDVKSDAMLYGQVSLDHNAECSRLYIDGESVAAGTYGSSSSAAEFKDDIRFAGTGVLTVRKTAVIGTTIFIR